MQNYKKKYIRKDDRTPIGVTVLVKDEDGQSYLGYSLCSPKDKFDKKLGTVIALRRATDKKKEGKISLPNVLERQNKVMENYELLEKTH